MLFDLRDLADLGGEIMRRIVAGRRMQQPFGSATTGETAGGVDGTRLK